MSKRDRSQVESIYLFTDLEGCAGIDDWDPRHHDYVNTARYIFERSEMQRLLTAEVNACIEGCVAAGVEQVIVNDAHGAGRTILIEELHPAALLLRGKKRPSWTFAMDRCDALFHLGMHAMANTPGGTLCHTMSGGVEFRVNKRPAGEFTMSMLIGGELGLPSSFFSGEKLACAQARELVPGIVTAETKEGLSVEGALHSTPPVARKLIREKSIEAVEATRAGKFKPLVWEGPFELEVEYTKPMYKPEDAKPGMRYVNDRTMEWRADTFVECFEFYRSGTAPESMKKSLK
jgi:D-amino peptidase